MLDKLERWLKTGLSQTFVSYFYTAPPKKNKVFISWIMQIVNIHWLNFLFRTNMNSPLPALHRIIQALLPVNILLSSARHRWCEETICIWKSALGFNFNHVFPGIFSTYTIFKQTSESQHTQVTSEPYHQYCTWSPSIFLSRKRWRQIINTEIM